MMPYTDYTVRLGDLKRAIMKNPYDPNLDIDGYMRYLKYNTPSAQPEIIRCKECKCKDKYENFCRRFLREIDPSDYCSYAEGKE